MNKAQKSKVILIEIESLYTCQSPEEMIRIAQEIIKDAKELAEIVMKEAA